MSGDSLLYWNQCTLDDCDKGCGLGRVRITFEEDRYLLAVWFSLHVQNRIQSAIIKHDEASSKRNKCQPWLYAPGMPLAPCSLLVHASKD